MVLADESEEANFALQLNGAGTIDGSSSGAITAAATAASFSGYAVRRFVAGDTISIINNGTSAATLINAIDGAAVDSSSLIITRIGL